MAQHPDGADARKAAEQEAFAALFDREYDRLVRFLMRYTGNLQDAQDAVAETFVSIWELTQRPGEWEKIRKPEAYLRKVALNMYRRPPGTRRRPRALAAADLPDLPQTDLPHAELTEQTQTIIAALRELEEEPRAVMALRLDGYNSPEIADILETTDMRVRDLLKKARRILKRRLAEEATWNGRRTL